jgi:hypothetical protein
LDRRKTRENVKNSAGERDDVSPEIRRIAGVLRAEARVDIPGRTPYNLLKYKNIRTEESARSTNGATLFVNHTTLALP